MRPGFTWPFPTSWHPHFQILDECKAFYFKMSLFSWEKEPALLSKTSEVTKTEKQNLDYKAMSSVSGSLKFAVVYSSTEPRFETESGGNWEMVYNALYKANRNHTQKISKISKQRHVGLKFGSTLVKKTSKF